MEMKNHNTSGNSSKDGKVSTLLRQADRTIEKWIFHFLDQVNDDYQDQTKQQNE
jgi:hypothetical protein